jgi:hypothetical protein
LRAICGECLRLADSVNQQAGFPVRSLQEGKTKGDRDSESLSDGEMNPEAEND